MLVGEEDGGLWFIAIRISWRVWFLVFYVFVIPSSVYFFMTCHLRDLCFAFYLLNFALFGKI